MLFKSIDELMGFTKDMGRKRVLAWLFKKESDGKVRYVTVACSHTGKQRIRSRNPFKLRPQSKTGCKTKLCVVMCPDGRWMLNSMVLDHSHGMNPDKVQFYRCHMVIKPSEKKLESEGTTGIRLNKCSNSLVVETGGHENLQCSSGKGMLLQCTTSFRR
ncbi:hypothetical protein Acr_09g0009440 [Actinidia rufa]|uniref:FAR1 domain-containing protein n=1 Tax=Actinidia rufa TaxID=165716 RepID=A0A7J0F721_9ERIC|nr:hypothetical protein Acr_09g0009440 [Actinidia rufa]